MRTIKFRAWSKDHETWLSIGDAQDAVQWLVADGAFQPFHSNDIVLTQFTGLHDKNGKEIYEGDIIKMDGWSPENYEVQFRMGGFCFANPPTAMSTDIKMIEDSKGNHCEVIGNIYENPELLKR